MRLFRSKWFRHFLSIFDMVPNLLRTVEATVDVVETPGNGSEKKAAALGMIGGVYDEVDALTPGQADVHKEGVIAVADKLIDGVVAIKNLTGQFDRTKQEG